MLKGGLLITGGTGYLGGELVRQARAAGHSVAATYLRGTPPTADGATWERLDIRDTAAVTALLERLHPRAVIHTAYRQSEPGLMATTADGAQYVARASAAVGARLIHLSSDVIFDGERGSAYREDDPPAPISPYGEAKARAEALVAAAHPAAAIVRTSLIYGFAPIDRTSQFVRDIAAGRRDERLYTDEYRCPILVQDLAAALLELLELPYAGVLNVAGPERLSRYEFGCLLAAALGENPATLRSARSADSTVRRPRNCTLAIGRARGLLRTRLRGVQEVLSDLRQLP